MRTSSTATYGDRNSGLPAHPDRSALRIPYQTPHPSPQGTILIRNRVYPQLPRPPTHHPCRELLLVVVNPDPERATLRHDRFSFQIPYVVFLFG